MTLTGTWKRYKDKWGVKLDEHKDFEELEALQDEEGYVTVNVKKKDGTRQDAFIKPLQVYVDYKSHDAVYPTFSRKGK